MNSGKKMSPMRAFQYSSALDTHSYPAAPALESELETLNREIRLRDKEIKQLKNNNDYYQGFRPLNEVGKSISFIRPSNTQRELAQKRIYNIPHIEKATIKLPDPRFNSFDPITGMVKNSSRSYSPFQDIGKRSIENYAYSRPFFH